MEGEGSTGLAKARGLEDDVEADLAATAGAWSCGDGLVTMEVAVVNL